MWLDILQGITLHVFFLSFLYSSPQGKGNGDSIKISLTMILQKFKETLGVQDYRWDLGQKQGLQLGSFPRCPDERRSSLA